MKFDGHQAQDYGHFETTHWSAVSLAGEAESPQGAAALAQLCQTYWYAETVDGPEAVEEGIRDLFVILQ